MRTAVSHAHRRACIVVVAMVPVVSTQRPPLGSLLASGRSRWREVSESIRSAWPTSFSACPTSSADAFRNLSAGWRHPRSGASGEDGLSEVGCGDAGRSSPPIAHIECAYDISYTLMEESFRQRKSCPFFEVDELGGKSRAGFRCARRIRRFYRNYAERRISTEESGGFRIIYRVSNRVAKPGLRTIPRRKRMTRRG